jgi:ankyrin repeat protein
MASKQTLSEELLQASENGETERVVTLLRGGADPNYKDVFKETPLHHASRWGHLEVVQQLLYNHGDVNATDRFGWTPLHDACRYVLH